MKKEEVHIYEVYTRGPYGETALCRTAVHAVAKKHTVVIAMPGFALMVLNRPYLMQAG